MQLAHKRKPRTILGNVVFLMVVAIIVFFFIIYLTNFQINKVAKVNDKYGIERTDLVPESYSEYTTELKDLGFDKYTNPPIEYVYLYVNATKIDRAVRYAVVENQCVTRTTVAKIDSQIQERDKVLAKFQKNYSKKLDKLYWDTYIDILENKYNIEAVKATVTSLPYC
ncbi:MAG: hypothetical protein WCX82_04130 [archaeon]|jgi:uncharacterized protein YlbG (UPF0298 family)